MKINGIFAAAMAAAVALSAFGCGSTGAAGTKSDPAPAEGSTGEETAAADEADTGATTEYSSQNPVMTYAGAYKEESSEEFYLMLEDLDVIDGVHVTVVRSDPDQPYVYWEINGVIDKDLKIAYKDAIKGEIRLTENGEAEETVIYEDGSGSFQITKEGKVTWQDDKEDAGKNCVFAFDPELTQQEYEAQSNDFQNPVMNWVGPYTDSSTIGRSMLIEALEENTSLCRVTITNEEENGTVTRWTMQGEFDEEQMTIEYKDCRKTKGSVDENGNVTEEETLYENGTGRLKISAENDTISWIDDVEDMGSGAVFVFNYDYSGFGDDGATSEAAAVTEEDEAAFQEDYYEDEDVGDEDLEYEGDDDSNETSED